MVTQPNENDGNVEKVIDDLWTNSTKDFFDLQPGECCNTVMHIAWSATCAVSVKSLSGCQFNAIEMNEILASETWKSVETRLV
jgi:hypothetical protein